MQRFVHNPQGMVPNQSAGQWVRAADAKEMLERETARLRAENERMRETLRGIRDANWREWDNASADEFVAWAQSRARHVLQDWPNASNQPAP